MVPRWFRRYVSSFFSWKDISDFFIWRWHTWVFLRVVPYFSFPHRLDKIKTRNTKQCYTPKYLISYLWSNCFFFRQVFLLISNKAGKAKWIEKRSVRSRPVKQIFLQNKIANCTHVVYTYIRVIWTLPCAVGLQNQIISLYPSPMQHHNFLRN